MARHASLHAFISDEQETNLRKLAAYLLTLPADYPDFEMDNFAQAQGVFGGSVAYVPACGTAACAVGHGPAAGFKPNGHENWCEYSERVFIRDNDSDAWDWCFAGSWSDTDNTVHGAAKRILWMLQHGLPKSHLRQRWGDAPLCYTDMVAA